LAYLGNQPSNNFVSLKRQVITGNGGSSYTLDHSVASVNDVAIFVNNVRQDPATYSISGTALTLGGTISSSDSCYVIFLGQALQTVTPATGTVTNAMLGETITVAKGGTGLTSGFKNGITMAQQWRLTADTNQGINAVVSTNWEINDNTGYSTLGTGLTESSGVFTFPSTGIYDITMSVRITQDSGDGSSNIIGQFFISSSADNAFLISCNNQGGTQNGTGSVLFNVTNTSTHKFRFLTSSFSGTTRLRGNGTRNDTHFTVIRLGDSV